jgi:hypothetical protein
VRRVIAVPPSLADEIGRVVAKLRTTPAGRLGARVTGPFPSRAAAGRALALTLAVAAQGIEDAAAPVMPAWRTLPLLADLAVGDQVSVVAHDFLAALVVAPSVVWTPVGQAPVSDLLLEVTASVAEVARFLL